MTTSPHSARSSQRVVRDRMAPGGAEARERGCTCPALDNGHGNVELARDRGGWLIVSDCPLHGVGGSHPAKIPGQPGSIPVPAEEHIEQACPDCRGSGVIPPDVPSCPRCGGSGHVAAEGQERETGDRA